PDDPARARGLQRTDPLSPAGRRPDVGAPAPHPARAGSASPREAGGAGRRGSGNRSRLSQAPDPPPVRAGGSGPPLGSVGGTRRSLLFVALVLALVAPAPAALSGGGVA